MGLLAKAQLGLTNAGHAVVRVPDGTEGAGRPVATCVTADGVDAGGEMIRRGYARKCAAYVGGR